VLQPVLGVAVVAVGSGVELLRVSAFLKTVPSWDQPVPEAVLQFSGDRRAKSVPFELPLVVSCHLVSLGRVVECNVQQTVRCWFAVV